MAGCRKVIVSCAVTGSIHTPSEGRAMLCLKGAHGTGFRQRAGRRHARRGCGRVGSAASAAAAAFSSSSGPRP